MLHIYTVDTVCIYLYVFAHIYIYIYIYIYMCACCGFGPLCVCVSLYRYDQRQMTRVIHHYLLWVGGWWKLRRRVITVHLLCARVIKAVISAAHCNGAARCSEEGTVESLPGVGWRKGGKSLGVMHGWRWELKYTILYFCDTCSVFLM